MNVAAMTQTAMVKTVGQGKAAATHGGIPDFARLLGLALSLIDPGEGATPTQGTGTGQGTPEDAAAETPTASIIQIAPEDGQGATEPDKKSDAPATVADTADPLLMAGQQIIAGQQAKVDSQTSAGQQAVARQGAVCFPTIHKANGRGLTAGAALSTKTAQVLAAGNDTETVKSWNVHELTHQIKAAIGTTAAANEGDATPATATAGKPTSAPSFSTQLDGDKIRNGGTKNLLQAVGEAKSKAAAEKTAAPATPDRPLPALAAAAGTASPAKLAQAAISEATPAPEAQPAVQAEARTVTEKAEPAESAQTTAASTAPQGVVTWTAQSVTSENQGTHMPSTLEQVRQVSDFLAERTEGVVRLSEKGLDANLRLYPPDLGGVRVQLNITSDHTAQAQFIVERPETAQLLQQHMRSFQQGMESHGLTVDRVQVTVQSTVRAASSASDSGWRPDSEQDARRESLLGGDRNGQQSKRNAREQKEYTQG